MDIGMWVEEHPFKLTGSIILVVMIWYHYHMIFSYGKHLRHLKQIEKKKKEKNKKSV